MTLESEIKVTYTKTLSTACNAKSSLFFLLMVFLFGIMVAYYVWVKPTVPVYCYDLEVKGQVCVKSVLWLITF